MHFAAFFQIYKTIQLKFQNENRVCFFFARIGRSDLTKKFEKVGPFECDELGYVVWLLEKQKDPPPGRVVNARN